MKIKKIVTGTNSIARCSAHAIVTVDCCCTIDATESLLKKIHWMTVVLSAFTTEITGTIKFFATHQIVKFIYLAILLPVAKFAKLRCV